MNIQSLSDAELVLQKYIPAVMQITGKHITLGRMQQLMNHIGNPQNKLAVIHVAGTSGKTSTSYYTAALLQHMGYKVGLTVSPHIDSVTERIQLNGKPISDKAFCNYLQEFIKLISTLDFEPTYFELLMAMAYWVFDKEGVDVAVIETGIGGLQDGSNVVDRADKICVITDIGYDHMNVLGNTLGDIAAQKAGIIQNHNVVCMYRQQHSIMQAIRERIEQQDADLHMVAESKQVADALPAYQLRNFNLALYAADVYLKREGSHCSKNAIDVALKTYIPARMDTKTVGSKTIIFDGAHNQQKMHAFVASMQKQYPNKKFVVLLAMKQGKEYSDVLTELKPITESLILTSFELSQDLPSVSQSCESVQLAANKLGINSVIITDQQKAYSKLLSNSNDVGIVTGSFYLIAQLRSRGIAASL